MAVLAGCMLVADLRLDPAYPFLLLVILLLALAASIELHRLIGALPHRPPFWLCAGGVFAVLLANWPVHLLDWLLKYYWPGHDALHDFGLEPWQIVAWTFAAVVMAAFVAEMPRYRDSAGAAVQRAALTVWFIAYLGVLPNSRIASSRPSRVIVASLIAGSVAKVGGCLPFRHANRKPWFGTRRDGKAARAGQSRPPRSHRSARPRSRVSMTMRLIECACACAAAS